jgi:ADP-heptose:LPS heptosyltransferase
MELGAKLLASGVGRIIICGGKADEGTNQSIYKGIGSLVGEPASTSIIDLTAKTDLIQLISLFEIADLVIGADSGPVHLAAAVARPLVVAVHGSTPWLRNGPYGQKGRAVYAAIPCQPCFSKTCSLKTIECLRDLPADKVIEAIAQAL